jgi:NAD(P)-dependent dehydrogenase (short-subunit alcohol dehydrogenase family)
MNETTSSSDRKAGFSLESFNPDGIAVVFGSSGGIGSAIYSLLTECAHFKAVIGFSRQSAIKIDLADEPSLERAAEYAADAGDIRLVIDATGFLHDADQGPEKSWRELDAQRLAKAFAINAIGPALLIKHLLPRFPRSGKSVFASLSARVGSIGDNRLGGWYAYRASKAALNQIVRTASIELERRAPEAICVALHPGTVDTPLSAPFAKAGLNLHTPAIAAADLLNVLDGLNKSDSGSFLDWCGAPVPW